MRIGWLGLGKLGSEIVEVLHRQHDVRAYDIDPMKTEALSIDEVVKGAEVVFIAVQTPHDPAYEGITRAPVDPRPFDLTYLKQAVATIASCVYGGVPIVVVSTVLPGDCRRELIPMLDDDQPLVYNPAFVAMGTVEEDFLHPEFVLLGSDSEEAALTVANVYAELNIFPHRFMSIESAELTKVAYNLLVSQKISMANTLMEICHKTPGANVDDVTRALRCADKRITSGRYMSGGMGDGGPCHPRDGIAMRWLAKELNLSADPFSYMVQAREKQTEWMARMAMDLADEHDLPLVLLGRPYKTGVDIETGSAGLLLASMLENYPYKWDDVSGPAVYVCCLPTTMNAQPGSVILDPWGLVKDIDDVTVIRVGR